MKKRIFPFILFCLVMASSCSKVWHVSSQKTEYQRIDERSRLEGNEEIESIIAPYRNELTDEMSEIIAYSNVKLVKSKPMLSLGNWFTDVVADGAESLYKVKIDLAIQNHGGIRIPFLNEGPIKVENIYEIMPFDNELLILELPGETLIQLLDHIAASGGWPVSHHLKMDIINNKAANVKLSGEPFEIGRTYKVAIPDYIANGGDNCNFLKSAKRNDANKLVRDLVIEQLKSIPDYTIDAAETGRINIK